MLVLIWPAYLLAQFMSVLVTRRGPAPGDGPDGAEAHSTSGDEKPETHSKGGAASPQEMDCSPLVGRVKGYLSF